MDTLIYIISLRMNISAGVVIRKSFPRGQKKGGGVEIHRLIGVLLDYYPFVLRIGQLSYVVNGLVKVTVSFDKILCTLRGNGDQ